MRFNRNSELSKHNNVLTTRQPVNDGLPIRPQERSKVIAERGARQSTDPVSSGPIKPSDAMSSALRSSAENYRNRKLRNRVNRNAQTQRGAEAAQSRPSGVWIVPTESLE